MGPSETMSFYASLLPVVVGNVGGGVEDGMIKTLGRKFVALSGVSFHR